MNEGSNDITAATSRFALLPSQVPDFPKSTRWDDLLRWAIAVADVEDDDIGFMASLLSYAVDKGGLTDKQVKYATRCVSRIHALWLAHQLISQQTAGSPAGLLTVQAEGNA